MPRANPLGPRCRAALVVVTCLLLTLASPFAAAFESICERSGDRRWLRVELPGQEHLCEVSVTNAGGERRVMWNADNDSLFCSAKARELRARYESDFGFECSDWPDTDGTDSLSPPRRRALDEELKTRLKGTETIRVTPSRNADDGPALIAVRAFYPEDGGAARRDMTRLFADDGQAAPTGTASWSELWTIDDLVGQLRPSGDERIASAWIKSVDDDGSLEVGTLVDAPDGTTGCRGRQTLGVDAVGVSRPRTPHRWVCDDESSVE